jgi:hypothetical protein
VVVPQACPDFRSRGFCPCDYNCTYSHPAGYRISWGDRPAQEVTDGAPESGEGPTIHCLGEFDSVTAVDGTDTLVTLSEGGVQLRDLSSPGPGACLTALHQLEGVYRDEETWYGGARSIIEGVYRTSGGEPRVVLASRGIWAPLTGSLTRLEVPDLGQITAYNDPRTGAPYLVARSKVRPRGWYLLILDGDSGALLRQLAYDEAGATFHEAGWAKPVVLTNLEGRQRALLRVDALGGDDRSFFLVWDLDEGDKSPTKIQADFPRAFFTLPTKAELCFLSRGDGMTMLVGDVFGRVFTTVRLSDQYGEVTVAATYCDDSAREPRLRLVTALGGLSDYSLCVWDADTYDILWSERFDGVFALAVYEGPYGPMLAAGRYSSVQLWDLSARKIAHILLLDDS